MNNSPYEGMYDRTGLVCLGRVISVDAAGRRLRVKTMGMPARGTDDLDLYNVRILHGQWHAEGDEEVSIPRKGTYGVVIFLGTETFWLGAVPLDMTSGQYQRANQVALNEGDKIIKTVAGNRIILRTGGTIEIQSTLHCRTFYIPNQNLINTICHNYELQTSGGRLFWKIDKKELTTNLNLKAWNTVNPDNGIELNIGTVPDTSNEEAEGEIKPYVNTDLVLDFKQGALAKDLSFSKRTLRLSVKKDGSLYFDIGPEKMTMTVDAATGNVTFETKGTVKGLVKKDVDLTVEGSVKAVVKKDISMTVDGSVNAKVKK